MKKEQQNDWKVEVLKHIFLALVKNESINKSLIFKGAMILNKYIKTPRMSLDIDSNLDAEFVSQYKGKIRQENFLNENLLAALTRYFEGQDPVKYKVDRLLVERRPKSDHPFGWDAFEIAITLIDHGKIGIRGLPKLTIDIAAPETLSANSVVDFDWDGIGIKAYSLERIAGEKARAYLSSLPTYRNKIKKGARAVRVKDLYDLVKIIQDNPIHNKVFWGKAGSEFRLACESRYVDCEGLVSFKENWDITREFFVNEPIIPKDVNIEDVEKTLTDITSYWKELKIIPAVFPLPEQNNNIQPIKNPHQERISKTSS